MAILITLYALSNLCDSAKTRLFSIERLGRIGVGKRYVRFLVTSI